MKKRILCALLCLGLCLSSVQAAEGGFADVGDTDWFSPYVSVCVEHGLMNGTGEGMFSPARELSQAESLALAARLHELQNGGNGVLPEAPADWGRLTLTTADGEETSGFFSAMGSGEQGEGFFVCYPGKANPWAAALWVGDDRAKWGSAMDQQSGTLTVEGETYSGMTYLYDYDGVRRYLYFLPGGVAGDRQGQNCDADAYHALGDVLEHLERYCPAPEEGQWLRDACYYATRHGLDWLSWDFQPRLNAYPADRLYFSFLLSDAARELEAVNQVGTIPDLAPDVYHNLYTGQEELERVYKLYRAGILNGVDAQGNFDPFNSLTRSEAAAMLSRVLEPSLRLGAAGAEPQQGYTLTPVDLPQGWVPTADSNNVAAGWAAIQRLENEAVAEDAIYRADGTVLDLEGYLVYGFESVASRGNDTLLPVLTYEGVSRDDSAVHGPLWNIYDVEQGTFLLEEGVFEDSSAWDEAYEAYLSANPLPFRVVHLEEGGVTVLDEAGRELLSRRYSELFSLGDGVFTYWGDDWQTDCGIVTLEGVETPTTTFSGYFNGGLHANHGLIAMGHEADNNWVWAYYDYAGNQISQDFDWAGPIGDDGAGFVCQGGRLFRIQF